MTKNVALVNWRLWLQWLGGDREEAKVTDLSWRQFYKDLGNAVAETFLAIHTTYIFH